MSLPVPNRVSHLSIKNEIQQTFRMHKIDGDRIECKILRNQSICNLELR
jgi:hypothetical protein